MKLLKTPYYSQRLFINCDFIVQSNNIIIRVTLNHNNALFLNDKRSIVIYSLTIFTKDLYKIKTKRCLWWTHSVLSWFLWLPIKQWHQEFERQIFLTRPIFALLHPMNSKKITLSEPAYDDTLVRPEVQMTKHISLDTF